MECHSQPKPNCENCIYKGECLNYWQDLKEVDEETLIGKTFKLKLIEKSNHGSRFVKRKFLLSQEPEILSPGHVVEQLIDEGWEDNTAVETPENFEAVEYILSQMQTYRDILQMQAGDQLPPIMVHCSAGVGRTGTVCALFNMVESLRYSKENE